MIIISIPWIVFLPPGLTTNESSGEITPWKIITFSTWIQSEIFTDTCRNIIFILDIFSAYLDCDTHVNSRTEGRRKLVLVNIYISIFKFLLSELLDEIRKK